jgi:hypothetical protein
MSGNNFTCVCFQDYIIQLEEAQDKIDELRAREAKLREALEKIVRVPLWDEYKCIDIARAALEEEKKQ